MTARLTGIRTLARTLLRCEDGSGFMEYVLIAAIVVVALALVLLALLKMLLPSI